MQKFKMRRFSVNTNMMSTMMQNSTVSDSFSRMKENDFNSKDVYIVSPSIKGPKKKIGIVSAMSPTISPNISPNISPMVSPTGSPTVSPMISPKISLKRLPSALSGVETPPTNTMTAANTLTAGRITN